MSILLRAYHNIVWGVNVLFSPLALTGSGVVETNFTIRRAYVPMMTANMYGP